jgi:hypothetical protein
VGGKARPKLNSETLAESMSGVKRKECEGVVSDS